MCIRDRSQAFGAGDKKRLRNYVAVALMLSAAVMVVLTAVTMVTTEPLLRLMRTPDNIMEGASSYLMMIYGGLGATLYYNAVSYTHLSIIRKSL